MGCSTFYIQCCAYKYCSCWESTKQSWSNIGDTKSENFTIFIEMFFRNFFCNFCWNNRLKYCDNRDYKRSKEYRFYKEHRFWETFDSESGIWILPERKGKSREFFREQKQIRENTTTVIYPEDYSEECEDDDTRKFRKVLLPNRKKPESSEKYECCKYIYLRNMLTDLVECEIDFFMSRYMKGWIIESESCTYLPESDSYPYRYEKSMERCRRDEGDIFRNAKSIYQ